MMSAIMNFINWRQRKPLPAVSSFDDVQNALNQVVYKSDGCIDYQQEPTVTWGKKTGDCEDFAVLSVALLRHISIKAQVLKIYAKPRQFSHAVCFWMTDKGYSYFSNSNYRETDIKDVGELAKHIRPSAYLWRIE